MKPRKRTPTDADLFVNHRGPSGLIARLVCRLCPYSERVVDHFRDTDVNHMGLPYQRARGPMRAHFHFEHPEEWAKLTATNPEGK